MSGPAADIDGGLDLATAATVLRRRWWLVLGLPALVLALSLATRRPAPPVYQATLTFAVAVPHAAVVPGADEGSAAEVGEALIDDLSRVIGLGVFAEAVAARLPPGRAAGASTAPAVIPGEIAGSLSATDRHRVADVRVTRAAPPGSTPEEQAALRAEVAAIAQAVAAELEENGGAWFARLGADDVRLTIIARPRMTVVPPSLQQRLELPLRLLLALLLGIGLAFLLHARDPRLYTETEIAVVLDRPILGRIPRPAGRWWSRRRGP
jgi:capsular polysaccharide biosynthesis protein